MKPSGRFLPLIVLAVLCGCAAPTPLAAPPSVSATAPVVVHWSENAEVHAASAIGDSDTINLTFIDPTHVVIGALFGSLPDLSAGRRFRDTIKRNAIIAVIDANSGQFTTTRTWHEMPGQPAFGDKLILRATNSGDCLVGLGDELYLLSPSLQQLAVRKLPLNRTERNDYPFQDSWSLKVAPSGSRALLIRSTPDYSVENHWIDLQTLKDKSTAPGYRYSLIAVSDDGSVVFNDISGYVSGSLENSDVVRIQREGVPPRELCPSCIGAVNATFGGGLIFLSTKPAASYIVANTAGKVLMRASHGADPEFITGGAGAANVNRVAFLYDHISGTKNVMHFAVADVDTVKEIWEQEVALEPEQLGNVGVHFTTPRLALSPDGHKFAILTSSTLKLLNLP